MLLGASIVGEHFVNGGLRAAIVIAPPPPAQSGGMAAALQNGDLAIPVANVEPAALHDTWGQARSGHSHTAIDIMAPRGTPALAAADGVVLKLHASGPGGLTLYLADQQRTTIYYYAHLDAYAPQVREGLVVARGDVIGYVGTTGNAPANTPHLHFGIEHLPPTGEWWKGEPINPYPVLVAHGRTFQR
jgi:murein DD-endopeptidase MepM/ murein hydrolase activator NlpD